MKKVGIICPVFIIICMLFGAVNVMASQCGEELTWELYKDGTLSIYGKGDMYNYGPTASALNPVRNYNGEFIPSSGKKNAPWKYASDEITKIVIEDGVASIGMGAFEGLKNVVEVTIPASVKSISPLAFLNCSGIEKLEIPEGVEKIYAGAFISCSNLKTVVLPTSLTELDVRAFDHCKNLEKIVYSSTEATWDTIIVGESDSLEKVQIEFFDETEENGVNKQIVLTIGEKAAMVFGEEVVNDTEPKIVNGRTMLPARFVAENLGANVLWSSDEPNRITVKKGETEIIFFVGQKEAFVNKKSVELDSVAFVENNRTYTPVRFIVENLGAEAEWNNDTRQVIITVK